jgi:2-hydroxychromene-2-carboxylate isomerase
MTLNLTLFWSFRSPYSYVLLPRINDLRKTHDVAIDLRIVHPAAIRNPSYFARMDPLARAYFMKDSARVAAFHGMAFRRPVPDPVSQDPVTLAISPDQPLAVRLGRLGIAAAERGRGLEFATEVSRLLWDGSVTGWDEGHHLAEATASAELNLAQLEQVILDDPAHHDARLNANGQALRDCGHWGVPTMVFDGEPFFGQDRFEVLVWRLKQSGLQERAVSD